MTILEALEDIKKFTKQQLIEQNIKLQREESEEYVTPYVEICYFPHKNFTPGTFQAPGILVSFDHSDDGANDHQATIRLTCSTYGGGYYSDENGESTGIPDAKGYIDLLNLMERLKTALVEQGVLQRCSIRKPVDMGIYDAEIVWPYWYGYLSFQIDLPASEFVINKESEDFLHGL